MRGTAGKSRVTFFFRRYFVTIVLDRTGLLRSLVRVPPAWSYSVLSGPKMPRIALRARVL